MLSIKILLVYTTVLIQICSAIQPYHECDLQTSDASKCIFTSSTPSTQETCLVWSNYKQSRQSGGKFCLRCMTNLFLTPTPTGQYCSTTFQFQTPAIGTVCQPTSFDQAQGAPSSANFKIVLKYNNTDGSEVLYCLDDELTIFHPEFCKSFSLESPDATQANWISSSIGCKQCKSQEFDESGGKFLITPRVAYNKYLQSIVNECDKSTQKNQTEICPELQVYSDGVCTACNKKLPMCLQCSDLLTCTVCSAGYNPVKLIDATGLNYTTCLKDTCGFDMDNKYGFTTDCAQCNLLANCLKCDINAKTGFQSCTQCAPGYFQSLDPVTQSFRCRSQFSGNIKIDLFVISTDGRLNITNASNLTNNGLSLQTPYLFINQAINDIYRGVTIQVQKFKTITVNIWLGKGVHHFLHCSNAENGYTSSQVSNVCQLDNMKFSYPISNNVRFHFAPLDCSAKSMWGSQSGFQQNCVDIQQGEKPKIRVSSSKALFNITNYASFSSLEFTAEDQLASDFLHKTCNYGAYPVQKCKLTSNPTGVVEPLSIEKLSDIPGCQYFCEIEGYDPVKILNLTSHKNCKAESSSMRGTAACQGQPYTSNFFSDIGGFYEHRHQVLFNLYAFDGLSSLKIVVPKIELVNCEFKYFLANQESLIQVQVNNILPIVRSVDNINQGDVFPNHFVFIGYDAGAVINITNCSFHDSKFCKGLIVYRKQKSFPFQVTDRIVNQTQFGSKVLSDQPSITLSNSIFYNLGFTNTLTHITARDNEGNFPYRTIYGTLDFPVFANVGMVLNIEQFQGNISISDCTFKQNMFNVPGIAYNPSLRQSLSPLAVKLSSSHFKLNQIQCLGNLLPQLDWGDTSPTSLFESMNIIHIAGMPERDVTLVNNQFTDNISLDGTLFIDTVNSVTLTNQNNFVRNQAYIQASGILISNTKTVIIDSSNLSKNSGFLQTRGIAAMVSHTDYLYITGCLFSENLGGQKGSGIYIQQVKNATIFKNQFLNNGPLLSFNERSFSPYFKYILASQRSAIYTKEESKQSCADEFAFVANCTAKGSQSKLPSVKGVIYVESKAGMLTQNSSQSLIIDSNNFYNNEVTPILSNLTQAYEDQASCVYVQGEIDLVISNNKFRFHQSSFQIRIKQSAPTVYLTQSSAYWSYSHGPLITMTVRSALVVQNLFQDNLHYQVGSNGSLLQVSSIYVTNDLAKFIFSNNTVINNNFIGVSDAAGMIASKGCITQIKSNTFQYNGNYEQALPALATSEGTISVESNVFNHLYCSKACLLLLSNAKAVFSNNDISNIVGPQIILKNGAQLLLQDQLVNTSIGTLLQAYDESVITAINCIILDQQAEKVAFLISQQSQFKLKNCTFQTTFTKSKRSVELRQSYFGSRPFSFMISPDAFSQLDSLDNHNGLIQATFSSNSSIANCSFNNVTGVSTSILEAVNSEVRFSSDFSQSYQSGRKLQHLEQNLISNCSSIQGPLIRSKESAIWIADMILRDSIAHSALISLVQSSFYADSVQFLNNQMKSEAVIYAESSDLQILNSQFLGNVGQESSCLKTINTDASLTNVQVLSNLGGQDTISAMLSRVTFDSAFFDANIGGSSTHGMSLSGSSVTLRRSVIQNSVSDTTPTGFFVLNALSSLSVQEKTIIRNVTSQVNGLLSASAGSTVEFSGNVSISEGNSSSSYISLLGSPNISISNTEFAQIHTALIEVQNSKVSLVESTFSGIQGQVLSATNSKIDIDQVQMRDSSFISGNGAGFNCKSCSSVSITRSSFSNFTAINGGALSINALQLIVRDSCFSNNFAQSAGALLLIGTLNTTIIGSNFTNNQASENGGAIVYSCPSYMCDTSLQDCQFQSNTAGLKGGALQFQNSNFTAIKGTSFLENIAVQGNNLGSFPGKAVFQQITSSQNEKTTIYDSDLQNQDKSLAVQMVPGQIQKLVLTIYDQDGYQMLSENQAVARIKLLDNQNKFKITGETIVAVQGKFLFENLRISAERNKTILLALQIQNLENYGNQLQFYDQAIFFKVYTQDCHIGEVFDSNLSCVSCPTGYYLFKVGTTETQCLACESSAVCYGGAVTAPKPGFWRSDASSNAYIQCISTQACEGGNEHKPLGQCKEGYTGPLCSNCQENYKRVGFFRCQKCTNIITSVVLYLLQCAAMIAAVIMLVRLSMKSYDNQNQQNLVQGKILVSHFQIMGQISKLNFYWGPLNQSLARLFEVIADLPQEVISPQCLFNDLFEIGQDDQNTQRFIYWRAITNALAPFLFMLIALIFWLLIAAWRRSIRDIRDQIFATMTVVVFLYQPTMLLSFFEIIHCKKVNSSYSLFADLSQSCFTKDHLIVFLVLVLPSTIFWLLAAPLFLLRSIYRNKTLTNQPNQDVNDTQREELRQFQLRTNFVTAGFKESSMDMEILISYKKVLISFFLVFLSPMSTSVVALNTMFVIALVQITLTHQQCYKLHSLHQFGLVCSFVQMFTICCGLFYSERERFTQFGFVFTFLLLLLSYLGLAILIYLRFRIQFLKWMIKRQFNGKLAMVMKTIMCGKVDEEKLTQMKIESVDSELGGTTKLDTDKNLAEGHLQLNNQTKKNPVQLSNFQLNRQKLNLEEADQAGESNRSASLISLKDIRIHQIGTQNKNPEEHRRVKQSRKFANSTLKNPRAAKRLLAGDQSGDSVGSTQGNKVMNSNLQQASPKQQSQAVAKDGRFFNTQQKTKRQKSERAVSANSSLQTKRQKQNFDYKNELEFEFEQQKSNAYQTRRQNYMDRSSLDEDVSLFIDSNHKKSKAPNRISGSPIKSEIRSHSFSSSSCASQAQQHSEVVQAHNASKKVKKSIFTQFSQYPDKQIQEVYAQKPVEKQEMKTQFVPRQTLVELQDNSIFQKSQQSSIYSLENSDHEDLKKQPKSVAAFDPHLRTKEQNPRAKARQIVNAKENRRSPTLISQSRHIKLSHPLEVENNKAVLHYSSEEASNKQTP